MERFVVGRAFRGRKSGKIKLTLLDRWGNILRSEVVTLLTAEEKQPASDQGLVIGQAVPDQRRESSQEN
ncbi:hypothetical protein KQX54_008231 [Cotesia glomerata]|uniref:Uncharacterized protein n=1 Tax=Cotesia glomerata TaxID=32391 RepID=A0AAV7I4S6_COTGL|nr:hypothetical protein KQX54_008231 [Cotesia glomerata]